MKHLIGFLICCGVAYAGLHVKAVAKSEKLYKQAVEKFPEDAMLQFDYIWENLSSMERFVFDRDSMRSQFQNIQTSMDITDDIVSELEIEYKIFEN